MNAWLKEKRRKYKENEKYFTRLSVKLSNTKDMDCIMKLQETDNKNEYIKRLIREDIERNGLIEDTPPSGQENKD